MNWKYSLLHATILVPILFQGQAAAQPTIATKAEAILKKRCFVCHGLGGVSVNTVYVLDRDRLLSTKTIVPGDRNSLLLQVIETGRMPPPPPKDFPPLIEAEKAAIREWITAGAPNWTAASAPKLTRTFLRNDQITKIIRRDLESAGERDRQFLRYYSIAHLYNAGVPEAELNGYRTGLSKLLNSLSWSREIAVPVAVDPAKTILRIDLRDLNWTVATWKQVVDAYPYGIEAITPDLNAIKMLSGATISYVRADWFVAEASVPPLYNGILRLPTTVQELERMLGVDVDRDIAEEKNIARGGVRKSGVSRNNRVVERHTSSYGAYWRSYDFSANTGKQNIFENPLDFSAAGGEIIFNLPNGMQAYFLTTGDGKSLDKGPVTIVFDKNNPDSPEVFNGRSCMSCHYAGMKNFNDEVRPMLDAAGGAVFDRNKALAIYPKQDRLDGYLKQDASRFETAVRNSGGEISIDFRTEPIHALSVKYAAEITLELAAAETGLKTDEFSERVRVNRKLQERSLGQLLSANGGVKRDLWEEIFKEVLVGVSDTSLQFATVATNSYREPAAAPPAPRATVQRTDTSSPRRNPKDGLRYVWIPPGTFQMGCSPGDEECSDPEKPSKYVTLTKGYWLGETEVTQAAYEKVTGSNPSNFKGADLPVESVNWNQAKSYCEAIGGRLPTEAEWEYAARGGNSSSRYGAVDQVGWYEDNSGKKTNPVKGKRPNSYGLFDMLGNVYEWTNDWFAEGLQGGTNPTGASSGQYKVLRGGSWYNVTRGLRASYRLRFGASDQNDLLGFRCGWE